MEKSFRNYQLIIKKFSNEQIKTKIHELNNEINSYKVQIKIVKNSIKLEHSESKKKLHILTKLCEERQLLIKILTLQLCKNFKKNINKQILKMNKSINQYFEIEDAKSKLMKYNINQLEDLLEVEEGENINIIKDVIKVKKIYSN